MILRPSTCGAEGLCSLGWWELKQMKEKTRKGRLQRKRESGKKKNKNF